MSIWDVFTGQPQKDAAEQQRQYLSGVQSQGMGALSAGTAAARPIMDSAYGQGINALNQGTTSGQGYLNDAAGAYAPLSGLAGKYGGATTTALGALGVNGQAGTDAARSAFTAGPGYNWNLDQGLEAINRRRNMGGMLASGNADRDAQEFGAGLASQEYDKWMNNLLGFTAPELQATSGAASGVAGARTNQAQAEQQRGQMLADLSRMYGTSRAGLETNQGTQSAALGAQLATPYAKTYADEANAQTQGSANLWGLGLGVLGLGTGLAGKYVGGKAA